MRIALDVMGGDNAPDAILDGACQALDRLENPDRLVLIGDAAVIRNHMAGCGIDESRVDIVNCTQCIGMDESPVEAVRSRPDSSISMMARLASRKTDEPLDAVISAGNTGALVTAAQMYMRRLPLVHRPGIAVTLPTFHGPVVLIDVGANIEPKPPHLIQYGVMGAVYARRIIGIENPRVGLMNVGGEEAKGTADMKVARAGLDAVPDLDFVGNVEGRGVFDGEADVVITDGVVGNVMIKLAEGLSAGIFRSMAREVEAIDPSLAPRLEPVVRALYAKYDYHEYGGAPLLGVNGVCIISHGSSQSRTICNAVVRARQFIESQVNDAISDRLAATEEITA